MTSCFLIERKSDILDDTNYGFHSGWEGGGGQGDTLYEYMNICFLNETFIITNFLLSKVFSSKVEKVTLDLTPHFHVQKKSVVLGQRSTHSLSPERERV